jgi:hypothetical protein
MNVFLEIAAGLRSCHRAQLLYRGFQELRDELLDLFPQPWIVQSIQQGWVFNVSKSAAQGAFHNVVVDHSQPRFLGSCAKARALGTSVAPLLQKQVRFGTVIMIAGRSDCGHNEGMAAR